MPKSSLFTDPHKRVSLVLCSGFFDKNSQPQVWLKNLSELLSNFNESDNLVLLGLNPKTESLLAEQNHTFLSEIDFEDNGCLADVNQTAIHLAANWYMQAGLSRWLSHKDINIGQIFQHSMTYFLLQPLKSIGIIDFLVSRDSIDAAFLVTNNGKDSHKISDISTLNVLELWKTIIIPELVPPLTTDWRDHIKKIGRFLWQIANFKSHKFRKNATHEILLSSDIKHVNTIIPHLLHNKKYRLSYLRDNDALRQLPDFFQQNIQYYSMITEMSETDNEDEWNVFRKTVRQANFFTFRGIGFWQYIENEFVEKYFNKLSFYKNMIEKLETFLASKKYDGILVDEDVCAFNKTLILLANKQNIPSIVIQHGAAFESVPIALAPVSATKIAAWGEYSRELLLKWGVSDSKITLTGVPRYDSFLKYCKQSKYEKNAIQKTAVLALDPFHERGRADFVGIHLTKKHLQWVIETVIQVFNDYPDYKLIIKLHPRDNHDNYFYEWVKAAAPKNNVQIVKSVSMQLLVEKCEFLMTICSTVAIEAMLKDKPVITINPSNANYLQPHVEKEVAFGVRNKAELKKALNDISSNGKYSENMKLLYPKVLEYYLYKLDGKASQRTAQLLENLMHKNKVPKTQEANAI